MLIIGLDPLYYRSVVSNKIIVFRLCLSSAFLAFRSASHLRDILNPFRGARIELLLCRLHLY